MLNKYEFETKLLLKIKYLSLKKEAYEILFSKFTNKRIKSNLTIINFKKTFKKKNFEVFFKNNTFFIFSYLKDKNEKEYFKLLFKVDGYVENGKFNFKKSCQMLLKDVLKNNETLSSINVLISIKAYEEYTFYSKKFIYITNLLTLK